MPRLFRLLPLVLGLLTLPVRAEPPPAVIRISAIGAPGQRVAIGYMGWLSYWPR